MLDQMCQRIELRDHKVTTNKTNRSWLHVGYVENEWLLITLSLALSVGRRKTSMASWRLRPI